MRLYIQNINKIKEADIALNGLTVIVGENDMGKSTIGRTFFSTIKAFSNMLSLSKESSAKKASKHIDSLYRHFYGMSNIDSATVLLPRSRENCKDCVRMMCNELFSLIILTARLKNWICLHARSLC